MSVDTGWGEILAALAGGAGAMGIVGAILLKLFGRYAWVRAFKARVESYLEAVVLDVRQTYVLARKEDPNRNGKLDPEEAREALRLAVDRFLELVGLNAIDRYLGIFGLPKSPEFVRRWATTLVEAKVADLSIREAAANGPTPAKIAAATVAAVRASAEVPTVPARPVRPGGP